MWSEVLLCRLLMWFAADYMLPQGGGPILGGQYLELLRQHKPRLVWEDDIEEHVFLYSDSAGRQHKVYFPSLESIAARLALAKELGTGIRCVLPLMMRSLSHLKCRC